MAPFTRLDMQVILIISLMMSLPASAQPRTDMQSAWRPSAIPWTRHTVDASSQGADGVKLADANGDGMADIVTGWEEGGVVRVYLNPGPGASKEPWPAVEVGKAGNVEDAVFVDVNADGRLDVVSSAEGETRAMFFHIAPATPEAYGSAEAWTTTALPAAFHAMRWMFAMPMDVDGRAGIDIVAAGKEEGAQIGWFEAPEQMDRIEAWKWHPLAPVGWIMSIVRYDYNGDGREDVVYSDRRTEGRGVYWFEKAGNNDGRPFRDRRYVGGRDHELMFMAIGDLRGDGRDEIVVATRAERLLLLERNAAGEWEEQVIAFPGDTGTGKGVATGDIDGDGVNEVIVTCENAGEKIGVFYLDRNENDDAWTAVDISGIAGTKFDRIELIDLDGDGDLDVLTCEESENLGVIWYENPFVP